MKADRLKHRFIFCGKWKGTTSHAAERLRSSFACRSGTGRAGLITAGHTPCCGYLSEGDTNLLVAKPYGQMHPEQTLLRLHGGRWEQALARAGKNRHLHARRPLSARRAAHQPPPLRGLKEARTRLRSGLPDARTNLVPASKRGCRTQEHPAPTPPQLLRRNAWVGGGIHCRISAIQQRPGGRCRCLSKLALLVSASQRSPPRGGWRGGERPLSSDAEGVFPASTALVVFPKKNAPSKSFCEGAMKIEEEFASHPGPLHARPTRGRARGPR
jgi:hypothetical protein